ncbi:MAG TPA: HAMP domain-containing sensor histidine kinase [Rhodothermales bacterium]|nr:HAMP domain-containing sensor histidine kinase [Rhodothermales bacterium]
MRSLTLKFILAFVVVCVVEAALVAVFVREATQRAFDDFVREEALQGFAEEATAYYEAYGSWEDFAIRFRESRGPRAGRGRPAATVGSGPPRPRADNPQRRRPPQGQALRFGLADLSGQVVMRNDRYESDQRLTPAELDEGVPLELDGEIIAMVLPPGQHGPSSRLELAFLRRTDRALLLAGLGALLLALLLGSVLARTYLRPLHTLTDATQALAKGEEVKVPVQSRDELGVLTEAFNKMSASLAKATALRQQMTADIAHDLRTPLTVLSGYLEIMRDGDLEPTPDRIGMMYTEALQLQRMVQDLRTLSLADAGELSLMLQPLAPADLLKRADDAFAVQAEAKGIEISHNAAASLPQLHADPDRLAQVLANLISNALRYTPEGGQITLGARAEKQTMLLEVRDTGSGIPADALPHLFDRFYRVEKSRERKQGESGLGLAIAKSIVEAHSGQINVTSEAGKGTTFTIRLPTNGAAAQASYAAAKR